MITALEKNRVARSVKFKMPRYNQYNQKVLDAIAEAKSISRDPDVKSYSTMEELQAALEAD